MKIQKLLFIGLCFILWACNKQEDTSDPSDSVAQTLGDAMSAIDDSGGSDGGYAFLERNVKSVAQVEPKPYFFEKLRESWTPKAYAASCSAANTFGTCTNNVVARDFQECTVGTYTFDGVITFSFSDAASDNICLMTATGHSVSRDPDFTITGPRGGTLTVAKTGSVGQRIQRTAAVGVFDFTNDGIRRILSFRGNTLSDWTSMTTSAITIIGDARNGRVANGGVLNVVNNTSGLSCDFAPSAVTWNSTCNCAVSGTWSATCSDSSSSTYEITGCGTGTLTQGGSSETVTLSQCSSL